MARSFADIAFTPAVRAFQTRMGSRRQYAALDELDTPRVELTGHEAEFIAECDGFRYTRGEDRVKSFRSSEQIERTFCGECGSNLEFRVGFLPDVVWMAAGSFDEETAIRPDAHIFATSKAAWFDITDDLPQYEGYAPDP